MLIKNPKIRKAIYVGASALGVVLVGYGVLTQELANQLLVVLSGLLVTGVGGLAGGNTAPKADAEFVADQIRVAVQDAVETATASVPAVVEQVGAQVRSIEDVVREQLSRLGR
ncbi:hypothetical protein QNA24_30215 [Rhodococcus qingshengii]|uniref:hypothetical protein n=1 Tax=Rhodococcus TaxID=1827 RepID=UPI001E535E94|nr:MULTISPECIES: hypothetical protein [Rhodococcus]MCD2099525.1 hypothetical protein [Rhodococcus rhodochrous]MCD2123893.1 hypothetical protein [Rhodococcus rhodochrous]MCQ4136680.1 hypothetical protein [Rhodococcus rhodochrous]MDJ0490659.1 hypothetical protein [Rhodococcus qingshengii]